MKILFVTTTLASFPGDPNGSTGNCWLDFLIELSKKHDVTVVTPLKKGTKNFETMGNLKVIRVGPTKSSFSLQSIMKSLEVLKLPFLFFNIYRTVLRLNRNEKYDIIHSFSLIPNAFLVLNINNKKIVTCLGSDIHTFSYYPIIKQISSYTIKKYNAVVCVSNQLKLRVKELGGKRVFYISTPIKTSDFPLIKNVREKHSSVFIGRLIRKKGIYDLVNAIEIVKSYLPKVKVYMCADGPERKKLEIIIRKKNLGKNILLLGFVDRKNLIKYIKISYSLILPSHAEGTPSSVLEAMSVGRPIIATSVGGLSDLVTKEVGVLAKPYDPQDLADKIMFCLKNNWNPNKIRKKSELFDITNIVKEYENLYGVVI